MSKRKNFHIVLLQHQGELSKYVFVLTEMVQTLQQGFASLGYTATLAINQVINDPDYTNIVIGANELKGQAYDWPQGTIIYNTEHLGIGSSHETPGYLEMLQHYEVWDVFESNVAFLKQRGAKNVKHVPLGYVPQLTRISAAIEKDIDVLFYGSMSPRRKHILDALIARGVNLVYLYEMFNEERDAYIARAKIVLNMHYYELSNFESVRVSYLLANQCAVVTETGAHSRLPESFEGGVCAVEYAGLVEACVDLLANDEERRALAQRGFERFSTQAEAAILQKTMGLRTTRSTKVALPATLNVGAGADFREAMLNIDIDSKCRSDAQIDICAADFFEKAYDSERFGRFSFHHNQFDEILLKDVLSSVHDLSAAMKNCLDVVKAGGVLTISVPYDLAFGAWQDPRHVRAFNERSWFYYTDWCQQLGWNEARFDCIDLQYMLSPLGQALVQRGVPYDEISRTPRAIDSLSVVLRKRYLQEAEKR